MQIKQNLVSSSKYSIKCPYSMKPEYITFHNTDNDAPAKNEIKYMITNDKQVSFHVAVDDIEAIQGIPFNRNAFHCGDGSGPGNRKSIGVEICGNKLGINHPKFIKAEENAAKVCAQLLKQFNLGIDKLKPHKHWSGKNCPSTTNHSKFISMVKSELAGSNSNQTNDFKNGDYNCKAKVINTDGELNVRDSRPINNTLGNVLGQFKEGQIIDVGYCLDNWFGVTINSKQGFISGKYIELVKSNTPTIISNGNYSGKKAKVTADTLNIRWDRGTQFDIIGKLSKGDIVNLEYSLDGWISIHGYKGNKGLGYVNTAYLELI